MRAAVMRNQRIVIDTIPEPTPGTGEVVVRTLACGICGSDLELNIQFVLGYEPHEFAGTLANIAAGKVAVEPLITGSVGIDGVAAAFDELASPEKHAKILVEP